MVRFGYDGSRFHGLQPQKVVPTAGAALRTRLEEAFGQRARALGFSARTDAGVHALSNVCTAWFIGLEREQLDAVEKDRDDGLFALKAREVPIKVHARGGSSHKTYRYTIDAQCAPEHMESRLFWGIGPRLDIEKMQREARAFLGTHDFTAFRASRCSANSPVKTITKCTVDGPYRLECGERFFITIEGDAFLRNMVRFIVGTLAEVGSGWRPEGSVVQALATGSRAFSGMRAPARGLTLLRVHMNDEIEAIFEGAARD